MLQALFVFLQQLAPQRSLSRLVHAATRWRLRWWARLLIAVVRRAYRVNLEEAAQPDPAAYENFNAFFTRELKPGARPLAAPKSALCAPADGVLCALGTADQDRMLQAKGQYFSIADLLGGDAEQARAFMGGQFATIYLSPRDYHRVHMPLAGRLVETVHVPGKLFSVSAASVQRIPGLFARNERLVCRFDTAAGPMAVVLVGAMLVSSIETVWAGTITPPYARELTVQRYTDTHHPVALHRGDELGRFNMGSTVIVLLPANAADWLPELQPGDPVQVGQRIADLLGKHPQEPAKKTA